MNVTNIMYLCKHCNLQCKYCYEKGHEYVKMDLPTAKNIVDQIVESGNNRTSTIVLFGGEPTLNWDVLVGTLEYAYTKYHLNNEPIYFSMISNGTLLKLSKVRELFKYYKILDIQISIDGDKETHDANRVFKSGVGSHDIVVKNCKTLLRYFPFSTCRWVVSDSSKIITAFEYLRDKVGFRSFAFQALSGKDLPEKYISEFVKQADYIKSYIESHPHFVLNQITYPINSNIENIQSNSSKRKEVSEEDKMNETYTYFLPDGNKIKQKTKTESEFEHFTKGKDAKVNLLNK